MNGKEILLAALSGNETPRPAWVPFVGVHGGSLLNVSATEYLQSSDLIVEGLRKAHDLYRPDGLPIVFDLQLEAEVLGCELAWAEEVPPSVTSHPLIENGAIENLPEFNTSKGRFPLVAEATRTIKSELGDQIGLYGLLTGPFTLASHLRGSGVFIDMLTDPHLLREIMTHATQVAKQVADFYLQNGCDVIGVVDPMISQISADHFDEFVAPCLNELFAYIREQKAFSSLFVCGDATRNLASMCATGCDNVSVDENIALDLLKEQALQNGKSFGGNLQLTLSLLLGTEHDCKRDALRCIDTGGSKGFILSPGCDLPYGTPIANLKAVSAMVHDTYQREIARKTAASSLLDNLGDVTVPDFEREKAVIVDVITLDSTACAPCQYMVDAARIASNHAEVATDVREHKVKHREGIAYMCRLGVQKIPTICIDGEAKFISEIPETNVLVQAIEEKAGAHGKL